MGKPKMTLLEELVAERARLTLGATAVREVERLAEQFANAVFRDPVIRNRLRVLVTKHAAKAEARLLAGERRRKGERKS
jgi:hypothetical protein